MTMQAMPWVIAILMGLVLLATAGAFLVVRVIAGHADRVPHVSRVAETPLKP